MAIELTAADDDRELVSGEALFLFWYLSRLFWYLFFELGGTIHKISRKIGNRNGNGINVTSHKPELLQSCRRLIQIRIRLYRQSSVVAAIQHTILPAVAILAKSRLSNLKPEGRINPYEEKSNNGSLHLNDEENWDDVVWLHSNSVVLGNSAVISIVKLKDWFILFTSRA